MKNIIAFVKDKAYYFLGGTVIIIIILIIVGSCSNKSSGGSYASIESSMTNAAKVYYDKKPNLLPKEDGGMVKVTVATLIESELLKEIKDPKDSTKTCSGYVEVTKVGDEYVYSPLLTCKGNYEPDYLVNKIKDVKVDEYGNGVYTVGQELVYRGDTVNNYVYFNNEQIWRIVKVDKDGDIMLLRYYKTEDYYPWDNAYNAEAGSRYGITTNFLKTYMKRVLSDYYEDNFAKDSKAKIVSKPLCIGKYDSLADNFSKEKECSIVREDEKVGLLNPSDYQAASLDSGCVRLNSKECTNYNYLAYNNINSWLLNPISSSSYEMLYLSSMIGVSYAYNEKSVNPVIYVSGKTLCASGDGSAEHPYVIK